MYETDEFTHTFECRAWNAIVKEFSDDDTVVFGDVNLRENRVKNIHGNDIPVGSGGWPYMRYFNSLTGLGGNQYPKVTSERICVELSKENYKYMRQYVNDYKPGGPKGPPVTGDGHEDNGEL